MTNESDPSLSQGQILRPTDRVLAVGTTGINLPVYEAPAESDAPGECRGIAVHNPDGFDRLILGGGDGLQDGEEVAFAMLPSVESTQARVRIIKRTGNTFTLSEDEVQGSTLEHAAGEATDDIRLQSTAAEIGEMKKGLEDFFGYRANMSELGKRQDRLGEFVRSLGFSNEGEYPVPSYLQATIQAARASGIPIPAVRLFAQGVIPADGYLEAWDEGEFPASRRFGWYGHDTTQDHYRPEAVFRDDAMRIGQLYIQAVDAQPTITKWDYPDQYETNKPNPQKVPQGELIGQDKMDYAANCLDKFTPRLDALIRNLDDDPWGADLDLAPTHLDVLPEMVATIMASSEHRAQLMAHLEAIGSHALIGDKFSHETFVRELLARAQDFWGITPTPKPPEALETADEFGLSLV